MNRNKPLKDLPHHFSEEKKELLAIGIDNWFSVRDLKDQQIFLISRKSLATISNLKRLRGIAALICSINISQSQAALLLHSGIASVEVIALLTPHELIQKTGRFERQLKAGTEPILNYEVANYLIKEAKKARANSELTQ
tara:strand:- start:229 stop:645 length:417 start_codon:yes stop_codon:yes gene_type:complete